MQDVTYFTRAAIASQLTPDNIALLQASLLFPNAGRKGNGVDKWKKDSAVLLRSYLIVQALSLLAYHGDASSTLPLFVAPVVHPRKTITAEYLNYMINQHFVLARGISKPAEISTKHHETNAHLEFYKAYRQAGTFTRSLKSPSATKQGNSKRSTCLLGHGAKLFCNAGFLIINPDINDVQGIFHADIASGFGKKKEYLLPQLTEAEKKQKLQEIKDNLMARKISGHTEIIYHIKHDSNKTFDAIYYTENITGNSREVLNSSFLKALFLQKEHVKFHGKKLPIFEYSHNRMCNKSEPTQKDLLTLWVKSIEDFLMNESNTLLIKIGAFDSTEIPEDIFSLACEPTLSEVNEIIEWYTSTIGVSLIHDTQELQDNIISEIQKMLPSIVTKAVKEIFENPLSGDNINFIPINTGIH